MGSLHDFIRYEVLFTPLVSETEYGDTINVTKDIDVTDLLKELGSITNEVDNGDYDIGVFTFGDITIGAKNHKRQFSPAEDWRSIFPYKRDRTKVDVWFYDREQNRTLAFRGLINDDATRSGLLKNDVTFRVLSLDSILRQVEVSGGAVSSTQLFSKAMKSILNVPEITTVLNYDESRITVDIDLVIDDGDYFTDLTAKDALDELLLVSNSVLYIDKNDNLYVKPRTESTNIFKFYGRGDPYGRENIQNITGYNSGVQRAFSSVKVNDTVKTDAAYVAIYGFRQKDLTVAFVNNVETEELIAQNILDQFKTPKEELEIEVPTIDALTIELFDLVSIELNYRLIPADGEESLPLYGVAKYGEAKFPIARGSYRIDKSTKWKVIGINEKTEGRARVLKLRVAGTEYGDGTFAAEEPNNKILIDGGFALLEEDGAYILRD